MPYCAGSHSMAPKTTLVRRSSEPSTFREIFPRKIAASIQIRPARRTMIGERPTMTQRARANRESQCEWQRIPPYPQSAIVNQSAVAKRPTAWPMGPPVSPPDTRIWVDAVFEGREEHRGEWAHDPTPEILAIAGQSRCSGVAGLSTKNSISWEPA